MFQERNACEGPVARRDTCLCMLLSITPLVLLNLIEDENMEPEFTQGENKQSSMSRRHELVSSLQQLGEYESLLTPPPSISSIANQAAIKAILYLSGLSNSTGYFDSVNVCDVPINCGELSLVCSVPVVICASVTFSLRLCIQEALRPFKKYILGEFLDFFTCDAIIVH